MRFLDTHAGCTGILRFISVADSELNSNKFPAHRYAILSHRWGPDEDEVTFTDIRESLDLSHKPGLTKLQTFCQKASDLGCAYGWADTCCINKAESSELTEAINSMFNWYRNSHVCIVQLKDVPLKHITEDEWFERGWTLQELIAPKTTYFYDHHWRLVGTKNGPLAEDRRAFSSFKITHGLQSELSDKTQVPELVLSNPSHVFRLSVAQRMSWAAGRKTRRHEDEAYCLLGILNVNMPSIYGEGSRAFRRLQQALMVQCKDESMFAWGMGLTKNEPVFSGLFAPSPASFKNCANVVMTDGSTGFSEANGEVTIKLATRPHSMETYHAVLNCADTSDPENKIAILVTRLSNDGEYVRVRKTAVEGKVPIPISSVGGLQKRALHVPTEPSQAPLNRIHGFRLRLHKLSDQINVDVRTLSSHKSTPHDWICIREGYVGTAGIVSLKPIMEPKDESVRSQWFTKVDERPHPHLWSKIRWMKLGFDENFNPMLLLANEPKPGPRMEMDSDRTGTYQAEFEQAMLSEQENEEREKLLSNSWITRPESVPKRKYGWGSGKAVLRVDRRTGISGRLDALNLNVQLQLCTVGTRDGPADIWTVEISHSGGKPPEEDTNWHEMQINNAKCDDFCEYCCTGRDPGDTVQLQRQLQDELRERRFLEASDLM